MPEVQNRDLTLSPGTYLYLQSEGKGGLITIHRGPTVVNQTGQDQPVRYDSGQRKYHAVDLKDAVQQSPRAGEGDYVIIENPTVNSRFPRQPAQQSEELQQGRRIVIPGPWSEALYPGQSAQVIPGHRLRSNQYLIVSIYNDQEAENNWDNTVVRANTVDSDAQKTEGQEEQRSQPISRQGLERPASFAVGTRIIIKGTDVSFYIPCTGVEVVKDDESGEYVREAVTLEQLEYCCLIDESGKKEYPRGPAVVFPSPTQVFEKDSKSRRKFRPLELNTINGIHLKVTADFTGANMESEAAEDRNYLEGEELFVTGKTLQIYYPREELSIIEYGQGNKKHYSTAIPAGEGRYLIKRETGEITLIRGPKMLLADPRHEIPVRRVLSLDECNLWYPNNDEALEYNLELAEAVSQSPSGRSGIISEGDYRKRRAKALKSSTGQTGAQITSADYLVSSGSYEADLDRETEALRSNLVETSGEDHSRTIPRGTKFTQPRTLTLNTKYDGVPRIEIFSGFAVLIVGADGNRNVVEGPEVILLKYDEKLGHFYLSTGKPKTTDRVAKDVYLKVHYNQVGDIIAFESADHVKGKIRISMRVNFEGESQADKLKWFRVDNYVKFLCDHVRSMIAGMAKRQAVAEIKSNFVDLVRDAILGEKPQSETGARTARPGLFFEANNMRVVEVEVLELTLDDPSISRMLDAAQTEVVRSNIEVQQAQKDLEITVAKERIAQEKLEVISRTLTKRQALEESRIKEELRVVLTQAEADLERMAKVAEITTATEANSDIQHQAGLERIGEVEKQKLVFETQRQELQKTLIAAQADAAVKRFEAAKAGLNETLVMLTREDIATRLANAQTLERFVSGDSTEGALVSLLSGFPLLQDLWQKNSEVRQNRLARQPANNS